MKKYPTNLRIKPNSGFSLVDTMVGMVIALLGMIIIFQVFSVSESIKRTTTSGGDAQQTGAMALFTLERSLKEAGYGIFVVNAGTLPNDNPLTTAPVTITFGATNASDTIVIVSRKNWDFGSYLPASGAVQDPTFLPPAPTAETFNVNAQGQLVSTIAMIPVAAPPAGYAINGVVTAPGGVIADGIALMKAQYWDSGISAWTIAIPANPWNVGAVRLAIVARSAQPEKPNPVTGVCNTTIIAPTWSGGTLDLSGNAGLAAGDDWKCYRYKTFESAMQLRNVAWRT